MLYHKKSNGGYFLFIRLVIFSQQRYGLHHNHINDMEIQYGTKPSLFQEIDHQ